MSTKRTRLHRKSGPALVQRQDLFGPPLLLQGEDAVAYEELVASTYAAVKSIDVIDEIYINDFVFAQWEVMRLRRMKLGVQRAIAHSELSEMLSGDRALVKSYMRGEPDAVEKVNAILAADGLSIHDLIVKYDLSFATLATLPFAERLERLERLDDLIATAERRRDASLRELDRRGAILGHAVRRTVDTIENDKLKVIEGHKTRARHDD